MPWCKGQILAVLISGATEVVRKFVFVFKMCLVVGMLEGKNLKITLIYVSVSCMKLIPGVPR